MMVASAELAPSLHFSVVPSHLQRPPQSFVIDFYRSVSIFLFPGDISLWRLYTFKALGFYLAPKLLGASLQFCSSSPNSNNFIKKWIGNSKAPPLTANQPHNRINMVKGIRRRQRVYAQDWFW